MCQNERSWRDRSHIFARYRKDSQKVEALPRPRVLSHLKGDVLSHPGLGISLGAVKRSLLGWFRMLLASPDGCTAWNSLVHPGPIMYYLTPVAPSPLRWVQARCGFTLVGSTSQRLNGILVSDLVQGWCRGFARTWRPKVTHWL